MPIPIASRVDMSRIEISLTSFPERYIFLPYLEESLRNQTVTIDHVNLFIYKGDPLPETSDFFRVHVIERDLKSYNKLIHSLRMFPDKYILTLDDDRYYDPTHIEELITRTDGEHVTAFKVAMINGIQWDDDFLDKHVERFGLVYGAYPWGADGVLYPPHVFGPEIFDEELFMNEFPTVDDIYFGYCLALNGEPIQKIHHTTRYFELLGKPHEFINRRENGKMFELNECVKQTTNLCFENMCKQGDIINKIKVNYLLKQSIHTPKESYNDIFNIYSKDAHGLSPYVISLTTFPDRLVNIQHTLYSLVKQCDYIYTVIIWIYSKQWTNNELKILYNYAKPIACIKEIDTELFGDYDMKSYKKLLPILNSYYNKYPIITIDDDVIYSDGFFKDLMNIAKDYRYRLTIGYQGREYTDGMSWNEPYVTHPMGIGFNKILEGGCGVFYPAGIFNNIDKGLLIKPDIKHFGWCDDIYFAYLRNLYDIPSMYITKPSLKNIIIQVVDGPKLWDENRNGGNDKALSFYRDHLSHGSILNIIELHPWHYECIESVMDQFYANENIIVLTINSDSHHFKPFREYILDNYPNVYFGVATNATKNIIQTVPNGKDIRGDNIIKIYHDCFEESPLTEEHFYVNCENAIKRNANIVELWRKLPKLKTIEKNEKIFVITIIGNIARRDHTLIDALIHSIEAHNNGSCDGFFGKIIDEKAGDKHVTLRILSYARSRLNSPCIEEFNNLPYAKYYYMIQSSDMLFDAIDNHRLYQYSCSSMINAALFYDIPVICNENIYNTFIKDSDLEKRSVIYNSGDIQTK